MAGGAGSGRLPNGKACGSLRTVSIFTQRILSEMETAPEPLQAEVLDFVLFVKARNGHPATVEDTRTYIRHTPGVCGCEACIRRTRIAVWLLEEARRSRVNDQDLLLDYPGLTSEDLKAAWDYVAAHGDEIENAIRANQMARAFS